MKTFTQAEEFLAKGRKKTERKLENNTVLHRIDADTLAVRLHATDIVLIHRNGTFTLNSGGWRTVTTKARMNDHSPARISQTKGVWYIGGVEFTENIVVDATGKVVSGGNVKGEAKRQKMVGKIKKYIDGFAAKAVKDKGLEQPSGGCCWFCSMFPEPEKNLDHIHGHIDEKYYVPSLLVNAIKARNPNPASVGIVWGIIDREVKDGKTKFLKQVLRGYFKKLLPHLVVVVTPAVAA
jgi:hypothetical protein